MFDVAKLPRHGEGSITVIRKSKSMMDESEGEF